jgi:hypothetical protein
MPRFLLGGFLVLHGMVHLLYVGQALRLFELSPGLTWPEGAWAFSRILTDRATRTVAAIGCGFAAAGFIASGAGILMGQSWSRLLVGVAASFSALDFVLLWNGRLQRLPDQGWVAVIINLAILFSVFILHWPPIGF